MIDPKVARRRERERLFYGLIQAAGESWLGSNSGLPLGSDSILDALM